MTGLSDAHALVTGGGRGIGRAIASSLSKAGATVSILGRDRVALETVVAAGQAHHALVADVADDVAMAAAIRQVSNLKPIDILVANAGAAESAPFVKADVAQFRRMLDINLMGVVHAVQAVLPGMIAQRRGRIIAVASTAGLKGYAYATAYSASKHAVVGLVRSLAIEVASKGITVNAVCPGFTDTDLVVTSLDTITARTGHSRDDARAELARHNPQGRLVLPDEVADAVLWLAGAGASSVTGQTIVVAGGEI